MKIKSIRSVKPRKVYAITTSTGTFIADGLAHHNCVGCNMFKQGNQFEYGRALDLKYGNGTADKLHDRRFETHKFTIQELEEIIEEAKANIAL